MKMIDIQAVRRSLLEDVFPIEVDADDAQGARRALERMMAVPRDH
jgi:quinolinate synthase